MNIQELFKEIEALKVAQQNDLQKATEKIQDDFEAYIKDKSISLYDRWNAFLSSPDELSNSLGIYPSIYYDSNRQGLEFFQDELLPNIMDSYHYEANMKDDYPLRIKENGEVDLSMVKLYLDERTKNTYSDEKLTELIIDGAEEILEKNFYSFTCDT